MEAEGLGVVDEAGGGGVVCSSMFSPSVGCAGAMGASWLVAAFWVSNISLMVAGTVRCGDCFGVGTASLFLAVALALVVGALGCPIVGVIAGVLLGSLGGGMMSLCKHLWWDPCGVSGKRCSVSGPLGLERV